MRIAMALLTVSLAFASACKKEKKAEPTAGSAGSAQTTETGSAAGSAGSAAGSAEAGSAATGSAAGSGDTAGSGAAATTPMQNKGGNCPSLVSGATTKAELKDGKVILTISAADKDAIAAIQKRTEELLKAKGGAGAGAGDGSGTAHDQKGTHGGGMGLCPVHVQEGGEAEAKNEASGVVITLTPKNNADAYKAEIDSRIAKAAEWAKTNVQEGDKGTQGGVGGGSGGHGMNHSGEGDGKGQERKAGDGKGGGAGTGGGGGMGTGGGGGKGTGGGGGGGGGGKGGEKTK